MPYRNSTTIDKPNTITSTIADVIGGAPLMLAAFDQAFGLGCLLLTHMLEVRYGPEADIGPTAVMSAALVVPSDVPAQLVAGQNASQK
jgi:hypothetical protein